MFVKKLKKALVTVVAGCMVFGSTFTSLAAGEAYKVKDLFVADTYLEEYVDLQEAIGDNDKALLNHYLTYGVNEERESSLSHLIDLKKYRAANADLDAAFGDNWDAYLNHYVTFGFNEGRESFGTFDAEYYAEKYPDLMAAFGKNVFLLYRHYLEFGVNEGRWTRQPSWEGVASGGSSSSATYAEVAVSGRVTDPETGAVITNAEVTATLVSGSRYSVRTVDSVSDGDPTVSGGDISDDGCIGDGVYRVYTDANGGYVFPSLIPGTYTISVTAAGYMNLVINTVEVTGEEAAVQQEPATLLSTTSEGPNAVKGVVTDATTGEAVEGVTVSFRTGWGVDTGNVVGSTTTNESGEYYIELDRNYYTATFTMEGYITQVENVISLSAGSSLLQSIAFAPTDNIGDGDYRIVLTWGEIPSDLDSHLYGKTETSDEIFHVYFGDKEYYEDEVLVANLDVDDVTSYGPETVTIIRDVVPGSVYRYSVHDFTNGGDSESYEMANSGATVKVYKGTTLLRTYNVPANMPGFIWNVFEINGDGSITSLNTINSMYSSMTIAE